MQRRENGLPNPQTSYENLLNHVVLPRILPEGYLKDHEDQELSLLSNMVHTVERNSEWIPSATVRLCQRLKRAHMSRTPETISNEISQLRPGETFAMFVRRQNTGLMIHMPSEQVSNAEKTVTVVTFPGNLHPKEIYDHTSDLEVNIEHKHQLKILGFRIIISICSSTDNISIAIDKSKILKNASIRRVCVPIVLFVCHVAK